MLAFSSMKEAYYIHGLYCVRLSVSKAQFIWPAHEILVLLTYSKTVLSGHSKKRPKLVIKTDYRLRNAGQSIAECYKGSILQYFRPSFSYHLSLRSLFCLFLSGHLRQAYLYEQIHLLNTNAYIVRGARGLNVGFEPSSGSIL